MLTIEMLRHGPTNGRWAEFCRLAQELFTQMLRHLETEERIICSDCSICSTKRPITAWHFSISLRDGCPASP